MKKILLFTFAITIAFSVSAQSTNKYLHIKTTKTASFNAEQIDAPLSQSSVLKSSAKKNVISSNMKMLTVSIDSLGQSANAYGLYGGGKTAIWADPNINSIVFTHRHLNPSGTIDYDFSADGGSNWTNNVLTYLTTNSGARYPQGVIYNPSGNTDPANAYAASFSSLLDATNGTNWGGYAISTHKLTDTAAATVQTSLSSHDAYKQVIPEAMHINPATGKIWVIDPAAIDASPSLYTDSIIFTEGVFNAGTQSFDYTQSLFYAPTFTAVANSRIAFAPDGNIGWISLISHSDSILYPDSCYHPIFYKTNDGGATWSNPITVNMTAIDEIKNFVSDSMLAILIGHDPVDGTRDSILYSTAFDGDMAVDGNGNPYLAIDICLAAGGYSITTAPGSIGMFLIFSTDGGTTWDAKFLSYLETFRGTFTGATNITEDNRPQISTTFDGSKMFVTWLDTDTVTFGSAEGNYYPDIRFRGYDPATGLMTPLMNVTAGSEADGRAYMGTASYYVFDNSGTYEIPLMYQAMNTTDNAAPVQYMYIKGFTVSDADFAGINEVTENVNFVSQNYPNPFNGSTNIVVGITKTSELLIYVTNLLGQKVSEINKGSIGVGNHTITIDCSKLTSGIYFYTVKAGESVVTHKMIVK